MENLLENENMTFTAVNEEGVEIECEVLFTFDCEETGHSYIIYTDNTADEDGNLKVYANIYDPNGEDMRLIPITTEAEWALIENVLDEMRDEYEEE